MRRVRVLVVDDSAFARTVLARELRRDQRIEVVGTARDGADALERIETLDPDVVTLDLTMPHVDGLGVLRALRGRPRPRVIVVSISSIDTELGADALTLGAIDLVAKPTALANERLEEIATALIAKTLAAGEVFAREAPLPPAPEVPIAPARTGCELVMIGTSTGGPQALTRVLSELPADLPAPVAMVLHIPADYTAGIAERLDRVSPLRVVEARDKMVLEPGLAILARGGMHLRVKRRGGQLIAEVSIHPPTQFVPSVDELFTSGARAVGRTALGVVLTGMGNDGLAGARLIAAEGGSLLTESAATSIVYGMPRTVYEAGLGASSVSLDRIAAEIARRV
ncbi:MAG TPA: chemotaxis-specific protein-glutamate methyltransferase CheB [Kofleriaceae bacterium]|nr:chemotaxis-specific protein-glutamate methyltransferase CheB [Kofleriaceae bacterium]